MRKALLLVGALMVVMFAAESYAETTVGGTIDVRGRWRENNNDVNKDYYGSTAYWEEKVNLWVDAKVAEGLSVYVEFQSRGSDGFQAWGTSRTTSTSNLCTRGTGADVSTTTGECANTSSVSNGTDSAPNSVFNENRGL